MLLENFKTNIPEKYFQLNIKEYIKSNYNFYNIEKLEKCIITIIYNIHNRMLLDKRKKINRKIERYLLINKNPNQYPFKNYTYYEIINSIKILKELNIIEEITGYRKYYRNDNKWNFYEATLTKIFLKPFEEWNIKKLNLSWFEFSLILFCYKKPKPIIKTRIKTKEKNKIIFDDTIINPPNISEDLNYINKYLIKNNLSNLQYSRIYGKNINSYGRFYNSFQNIPKSLRKKILKEQNWIELDYKSCIINILHLLKTEKFYNGDIYNDILNSNNLPLEFRDFFKSVLIIAINVKNKDKAIKAIRSELINHGLYSKFYKNKSFKKLNKNNIPEYLNYQLKLFNFYFKNINSYYHFTPEYILSILENILILKEFLYSNSSSYTQNIESNSINKIMKYMINKKILPLSIHDCIIIPKKYQYLIENYMNNILLIECNLYKNKKNIKYNNYNFYNSFLLYYIFFIQIKEMFFKNIITFQKWKIEYG